MTSGHDCIAIRAPHCSDDPWDRKRVFAREWRRLGSRLYESTSLPVLSLVPHNRPLFTCRSCKFANSYIPLCLWCAWSSPTDIAEFEAALARSPRRRVSGPDLAAYKTKSDPKPSTWPRNLSRDCISKPDVKPRTGIEEVDHRSSTAEIANLRVTTTSNISGTMESIEECRMIGRALEKAVEAGRVNDAKYLRTRRQRLPPRFPLTTITTVTSTTLTSSGDDSRLARPTMTTRHPSGSLRSRRLGAAIDISTPPLAVAPKQDDDRPSTAPAPKPAGSLRRVPGESRMRKRSSQSLRERSKPSTRDTSPSERRVKGSAPATTVPSAAPSTESSPPRTPEPRLGHPSRPYYTAIRKNMSQPTPPRTPSVAPSAPQTSHLAPRPSADQARQSGDYIARSSTDYLTRMNSRERASFPRRRIGGGSVSGEVELHMALAQRRSEDSPNTRQEYVFHETRPPPPELRQHRSRLQRLSNGVRNIFFGRS